MNGFCGVAGTPVIGLATDGLPMNAGGPAGPAGLGAATAEPAADRLTMAARPAIAVRRRPAARAAVVIDPDMALLVELRIRTQRSVARAAWRAYRSEVRGGGAV